MTDPARPNTTAPPTAPPNITATQQPDLTATGVHQPHKEATAHISALRDPSGKSTKHQMLRHTHLALQLYLATAAASTATKIRSVLDPGRWVGSFRASR
ncbi:uncharacterized protein H6S33_004302 [Morchella sextelata]|uniref:uncharacterized protein n=1 Tax=Morchella sextelata TaxID=1174677 RepID=UPI001D0423E3|nr:uncharacterized protein H6S33_004302 [Morchella sextelata]KAH0605845.1 hypothetical protein H6S33_004302 [Morchella sextelata]